MAKAVACKGNVSEIIDLNKSAIKLLVREVKVPKTALSRDPARVNSNKRHGPKSSNSA